MPPRGAAPRPYRPQPARASAPTCRPSGAVRRGNPARTPTILAIALVTMTALAGCHGLPHDDTPTTGHSAQETSDPAAEATPQPTGRNELPTLLLHATPDGADTKLRVTLDGDPDPIATHTLDFGDGSPAVSGAGAPAQSYTHTYPAPPDFRHHDRTFTAALTLMSAHGHSRSAHTDINVPAPPNQAPRPQLSADILAGPAPLRIAFTMGGTDPDGRIESWRLEPGDDTDPAHGLGLPEHPFQHELRSIGTHTIRLTLTDDQGLEGHTTLDIHVWPPQDATIWTIHRDTNRIHVQDGNGTDLVTHPAQRPGCSRSGNCETPVDVATGAGRAYVALSRTQSNGTLWILDGDTGASRQQVTIGKHPDRIWTDQNGGAWVTHSASGTIAHVGPSDHRATFLDTPLGPADDKRAAFSQDGHHAWVIGRGDTPLLVHIEPQSRHVDALALPVGLDPVAVAHQDAQNLALVAGADGRILYVTWQNGAPVIRDLIDIRLDPGATVTDLACHGPDHCWVTTTHGDTAPGRLIQLPARPDPSATPIRTLHERSLPPGHDPTGLTARDHALVIAIGGTDVHGILLADPNSLKLTSEHTTSGGAPGPSAFDDHPTQPHLAYVDAPDRPGWQLVDTRTGDIVHQAPAPFAADRFAVAHTRAGTR